MTKTIVVDGVEFEVLWDGTQCRPNSNTKGELLGSYTKGQDGDVRFYPPRARRPPHSDDADNQ